MCSLGWGRLSTAVACGTRDAMQHNRLYLYDLLQASAYIHGSDGHAAMAVGAVPPTDFLRKPLNYARPESMY